MAGSIVLIGFMGSGKSTIGRALAQRLGFAFVDTDEIVAARAGMPIPEIFRREGEAGFRKHEAEVVAEVARLERHVVATGGGAPTVPESAKALKEAGTVVHLDVDLETARLRTRRHAHRRPLLRDLDDDGLATLLATRRALYERVADLTIQTAGKDGSAVVQEILEAIG